LFVCLFVLFVFVLFVLFVVVIWQILVNSSSVFVLFFKVSRGVLRYVVIILLAFIIT